MQQATREIRSAVAATLAAEASHHRHSTIKQEIRLAITAPVIIINSLTFKEAISTRGIIIINSSTTVAITTRATEEGISVVKIMIMSSNRCTKEEVEGVIEAVEALEEEVIIIIMAINSKVVMITTEEEVWVLITKLTLDLLHLSSRITPGSML